MSQSGSVHDFSSDSASIVEVLVELSAVLFLSVYAFLGCWFPFLSVLHEFHQESASSGIKSCRASPFMLLSCKSIFPAPPFLSHLHRSSSLSYNTTEVKKPASSLVSWAMETLYPHSERVTGLACELILAGTCHIANSQ